MNLVSYTLPEGIETDHLSFILVVDMGEENEVYFDSFGIGCEKHPYGFMDGTSMAAPAVSGGAAVLASRHYEELSAADPAAAAEMLANLVRSSVRPLPSLADITSTGGILDLSVDTVVSGISERNTPSIKDLSVMGADVTISGTGFGDTPGTVAVRQYVLGNMKVLNPVITSWANDSVSLSLADPFEGIMELVLTAAGGRKDTVIRFISKSSNVFEEDHWIGSDIGEPFAFNIPDKSDLKAETLGDLETGGLLIPGDDKLYFMPEITQLEQNHLDEGAAALTAFGDVFIFTGPAARDGTSDTYILQPGDGAFTPYGKRVSDAGLYHTSAAVLKGRLYVIGASFFEKDHRVFRSTFLGEEEEPTPTVTPTPVPVTKKKQPMKVKTKTVTLKCRPDKKQVIRRSRAFTISKAKGAVTFRKKSGSKYLTISKSGNITVKKGAKKGTYTMKVIVRAAGNRYYKSGKKTVTVKVVVKGKAR